jgi:hypothetical protein
MPVCVKCNKDKDIDEFYKRKDRKLGYDRTCKSCNIEYSGVRQKTHRDRVNECARERHRRNPEKFNADRQEWVRNNPDKRREINKRYRDSHKEQERKLQIAWEAKNKDRVRAKAKRWASKEENKQKRSKLNKAWIDRNPGKMSEYRHTRRARLLGVGGVVRNDEWQLLLDKYNHTCLCCGRNDVKLTKDHIIPISLGGRNGIDNIQPLCHRCNSTKHTDIVDYRKDI